MYVPEVSVKVDLSSDLNICLFAREKLTNKYILQSPRISMASCGDCRINLNYSVYHNGHQHLTSVRVVMVFSSCSAHNSCGRVPNIEQAFQTPTVGKQLTINQQKQPAIPRQILIENSEMLPGLQTQFEII